MPQRAICGLREPSRDSARNIPFPTTETPALTHTLQLHACTTKQTRYQIKRTNTYTNSITNTQQKKGYHPPRKVTTPKQTRNPLINQQVQCKTPCSMCTCGDNQSQPKQTKTTPHAAKREIGESGARRPRYMPRQGQPRREKQSEIKESTTLKSCTKIVDKENKERESVCRV